MYTLEDFNGHKLFFCVTGCSLLFTKSLMSYGGASAFLEGIYCPYSTTQLNKLISGYTEAGVIEKYVSEDVARKMSIGARHKFNIPNDVAVVSITASLYKENQRPDRENHAFLNLSLRGKNVTEHYTLHDKAEWRTGARFYQEGYLADHILAFTQDSIKTLTE